LTLGSTANNATALTELITTGASALELHGTPYGLVADGGTGGANVLFIGSGSSPIGTKGDIGGLYVDANGDWWGATVSAVDGRWRKIAGPGTAGQLHVLPLPTRVYDSRPTGQPTGIGPKAPTVGNTPRTIDTKGNTSNVPRTANAVLITLTIAAPALPGFAAAWPSGGYPGTSNVNFAAGQNIATTTVVGCGPDATIQVLSNTVTDFLIDVIGYYQ
jgi:hypothetical protein